MSTSRQRALGGGVQHVLDYLRRSQAENPGFFYAIQSDNGNVFWADAASRTNYSNFGDTVTFDTSYRTNGYRVPFASFTGLNHHGQPVLFGSALILNESESSFVWLFQTWLQAMSGRPPISITTDPDGVIHVAATQILPETRLRYCNHGIFSETREKLAAIYQSNPTFEPEFKKCINEAETMDEFDSSWHSLLQRYFLVGNEWLQSMYNARQQWVPAFMRNTFYGELSASEENENMNSFFDGYVNAATTMQSLIKQYEKAVSSWHEKELKADHNTNNTNPILKTPSPMEKQAATLYTRRIFMKFQEELVETLANPAMIIDESGSITTFRVAKFGEEHKARRVSFNSFEMKANCSCQMFEYSGVICRHILAVFRAKNVLTLPSQYILKRWTRDAKGGALSYEPVSEAPNNSRESLTLRYNNLREEAIKYVEEGAKSIHVYNVAMTALREAAKKVAAAKNQASGTAQGHSMNNGNNQERSAEDNRSSVLQPAEEKERRVRELTAQLESINEQCDVYRTNLLAVLRDMEDQKLQLSVKVQNARLSLKE